MSAQRVAAIRAAAAAPTGETGPPILFRTMATYIARAWIEQICADADAWAAGGDERRRRIAQAARALAGEYANDIVHECHGQVPMIHKLHYINRDVMCVGMMLVGCIPLWLHYYRIIEDMMGTIDDLLPKEITK